MSAKVGSDELVPVREALAAGASMYFLDQVKAKVTEDWAGQPCITASDAAKALAATRADQAANDAKHRAYASYLASHDAERDRIARAAKDKAYKETASVERERAVRLHVEGLDPGGTYGKGWARGGGFPLSDAPSSRALEVGWEAARKARAKFDARHPVTTFEDFKP